MQRSKILLLASASASVVACTHSAVTPSVTPAITPAGTAVAASRHPGEPPEAPAKWLGLLGEYDAPGGMRVVLEDGGRLYFADTVRHRAELTEASSNRFGIAPSGAQNVLGGSGTTVRFDVDATGTRDESVARRGGDAASRDRAAAGHEAAASHAGASRRRAARAKRSPRRRRARTERSGRPISSSW